MFHAELNRLSAVTINLPWKHETLPNSCCDHRKLHNVGTYNTVAKLLDPTGECSGAGGLCGDHCAVLGAEDGRSTRVLDHVPCLRRPVLGASVVLIATFFPH